MIRLAGMEDDDDPIVWECGGQWLGSQGLQFTWKFLTRSARDTLLATFGEQWLATYLAEAEQACAAFSARGVQ